MARPTDWSALGLGGDPTPGDPDRIDAVITSQESLVSLADTIDEGLTSILNTTDGVFVGKTADALRKVIDKDLRHYVSTFRQAHKDVQAALRTYVGVMREQQRVADEALSAAAALAEDDEAGREAQKAIAEDAGDELQSAAGTAASALREAAYSIASPIDECEEFWKALGWLALILVIPAMIVGGPLALFAIGLNVALLIKTAIDFSQGKASITELVLSIIGVIAPTTKGIRLGDLWKGLKGLGSTAFNGTRNLLLGGPNAFGLFTRLSLGLDDVFRASGSWLNGLKGIDGLRFAAGLRAMPGPKGFTFGGVPFAGSSFRFVPAAVDLTVINLMGAKSFFAVRSVLGGLNGIRSVGASLGSGLVNGVRGFNSLRLFLPVAADEIGLGLTVAFRVGFIDRGVFGLYRYGVFAGGQVLATGSRISGGVAHGLSLTRPTADLGTLPHAGLGRFSPETAGGGLGVGLRGLPPISLADSMGSVGVSGFRGLGSSVDLSAPGAGARIVDVPSVAGPGGAGMAHIPTLGPMSSVSVPHLNGLHVPAVGGDIGAVGVRNIGVPHLGGNGVTRIDQSAVGGLNAVHVPAPGNLSAPAPGQVHVPAPTQMDAVSVGHVNVPSLGALADGPAIARLDAPGAGARVTDLPSVNGAGRVDVPSVSQVNLPSLGRGTDLTAPTVARVDVPSVGRAGDVSVPAVGRVDVPSVGRAGDVSAPSVARVEVPAIGRAGDVSVPAVGRVDVPSVGRAGDVSASAVSRVDVPSVGRAGDIAASDVARADVPALGRTGDLTAPPASRVEVPPLGASAGGTATARLDAPGTGARVTDLPSVHGADRADVPSVSQVNLPSLGRGTDLTAPTVARVDVPSVGRAGDVPAPSAPRVDVPAAGRAGDVPVPAVGRVDVASVGRTGDLTGPSVARVDVPAAGRAGDASAGSAARVDVPAAGRAGEGTGQVGVPAAGRPGGPDASVAPAAPRPGHSVTPEAGAGGRTPVPLAGAGTGQVPVPVVPVSHAAPPPVPAPSKALGGPGHGSLVADLPGLGRIDLSALALRTVEVRMMNGVQLNLQHTFSEIDDLLRGVRIDVRPGGGAERAHVTVAANPHGVDGVSARHVELNGQDVLQVERAMPDGSTHRWSFALRAPDYQRLGDMQVIPPGGRDTDLEMAAMPSGSGAAPAAPAAAPAPPPPRVLDVPGLGGAARVQVRFGETPGSVTEAVAVPHGSAGSGGLPTVTVRAGQGPGGGDLVHLDQRVGAAEVRSIDLVRDGDGLRPVSDERLITLAGGEFRGTTVAVDLLHGNAVRQVPSAGGPAPAGRPGFTGPELRMPTGSGFQLYDPATGLPTRSALRIEDGTGGRLHALPGRDGRSLRFTDADGTPVASPGATAHVQTGGGFRVEYGSSHVVVSPTGAHTHTVVPLRGTDEYVLRPTDHRPPTRVDAHGTDRGPLTLNPDNTLYIPTPNPHRTRVHDPAGHHTHDLLTIQGGPLTGHTLHLTPDGTPTLPHATITPQPHGAHRIQHGDTHVIVNADGAHTHTVIPLRGTDEYVLRPTDHRPPTRVDAHGTDRGPLTLNPDNTLHIPTPNPHRTRVHDPAGHHTHDLLTIQGGPLTGHTLHLTPDGTPTLPHATITPQPHGAHRIQHGDTHVIVNADGAHTHTVIPLRDTPHFAHVPDGGGAPLVRAGDGTGVPHTTISARGDGRFVVTDTGAGTVRLHRAGDGSTELTATRLGTGEAVHVQRGGNLELMDARLTRVDGSTVTGVPGGGHHVTGAGGEIRMFGPDGAHRYTLTPPGEGQHLFRAADPRGGHAFDAVQLSDGVGTRFVRTDTHALLDGDLRPVPGSPDVRFGRTAEGHYRVDVRGTGPHSGEYKIYDGRGRLTEQRINVIDRGTVKPNEYLLVSHLDDGTVKPSWTRVRLGADGTPVPGAGARKWYDGGTVDPKGVGNGRVRLVSHSGVEVMERRPLPGGHTVDAYHSRAGVGTFGAFNQRGVWTEFDAAGGVLRSGTRHWGESGRSWFDVTGSGSLSTRVRHFQENPDGGHVLARLDNRPLTQSFAGPTSWTRFDADFKQVAQGTRQWGPGRGYTDTMVHPVTGERVVMHEKFGRFTWSVHDVRRYHQTEIGADGVPKRDYTSWSPHGKENGRGQTLKDGGFLVTHRFAEQRPPVAFRWLASGEYRAAHLDRVPWLARDSRLHTHSWTQTSADGATTTHGIRFATLNTVTDVTRAGDVVRETRKLLGGDTVTVGDVPLPAGAHRQDGYLPWSQGEGKPQGHRTYRQGDFAPLPGGFGNDLPAVRWQERVTDDLADGDWYSPNAGKQWRVVRVGFADGSVVDFRPAPGAPGRTGHLGAGDWTRYDHQGMVVARKDTWPDPAGGNPVEVTSLRMLDGNVRWTDNLGNSGVRKLNEHRGEVTPWGWDRESFQDFDATGALVRDHRLLADGTTVDAWRGPDGNRAWHWNKTGADGAVKEFGTGPGDRVRQWFDGQGNALPDWRSGARFEDRVTSLGNRLVQEIPARPAGTPHFADSPHRVREYTQSPGDAFHAHTWKEYENGVELGRKVRLPDGTFLESEDWHKQWRRFAGDGTTLIDERSIAGYVWHTDTFGRTSLIGRETNFTGAFAEYRGFSRMWREPNRWEWGHTAAGVSTYTPFVNRAARAVAVDVLQEWLLDFGMNLAVYGIVAAATGTSFGWTDVGKAAFGATVSAGVKGGFSAGHFAAYRGGPWKTGLSHVDQGHPYHRRPNDDTWSGEFGGNEKVTRWRSGTYDFTAGLVSGSVSGFIGGAATAAIFGVKDSEGNVVHLHGTDALLAGAIGIAGGVAGAVSLGMARTALTQNLAGRWYHRQGFFDIFVVAGLGKLVDKLFANLFLSKALTMSINPGYYQGSGQSGEPTGGTQ
ncbi:hypothetical protein J2S47_000063 [Streptomyces griseoviridis]|uniref:Uncharacterized protein n=1 Tax=Streptomyces griseoviridis TaxID=45398 RepID=A0ABT9L778_STRGD|nr:hypothetical protein [Streptomyces griseoviridis]MDP9679561.1 hypothetical protein [Streptomyces griseoviridis]